MSNPEIEKHLARVLVLEKAFEKLVAGEPYGVAIETLARTLAKILVMFEGVGLKRHASNPDYLFDNLLEKAVLTLRERAIHLRNVRVLNEELSPPGVRQ